MSSPTPYRLALLADVHGNGPALQAVLDALHAHRPYLLIVAGDLIGGPHQEEVIARLRDGGALIVRGNGEDYLARLEDGSAPPEWHTHRQFAMGRWAYQNLRPETLDYLRGLPERVTIELPGAQPVCVFHGAPGHTSTHLHPDLNPGRLDRAWEEIPGASFVCGHSHIPWQAACDGRLALNPGAVSEPEGGPIEAQFALLDWDGQRWQPSFHCVPYDLDAFERDYIQRGVLATGPLARAHLANMRRGGSWGERFLHHARRLAAERGHAHSRFVPDDIWELAEKTFDWQEDAGARL